MEILLRTFEPTARGISLKSASSEPKVVRSPIQPIAKKGPTPMQLTQLRFLSILLFSYLWLLVVSTLAAQPTIVLQTELPGGAVDPGLYGHSVSLWSNLAVVGNSQSAAGGVFPFSLNDEGWVPEGELIPPVIADLTHFFYGREVAVGDQIALVSDPAAFSTIDGSFAGAAFVYRRVPLSVPGQFTWLYEQRLIPSVTLNEQKFGTSLAVWGNMALVGTATGSVHVYQKDEGGPNQWGEVQIITFHGSSTFGNDIALRGNTALVGAPLDSVNDELNAGRAFLFEWDSGSTQWNWEQTLDNPEPSFGENFGSNVDLASWTSSGGPFPLSTQRAIIGSNSSGAYAWIKTTLGTGWDPQIPIPGAEFISFGTAVAGGESEVHVRGFLMEGGDSVIRTFRMIDGAWEIVRTLKPSSGCCNFGGAVAADEARVVIGDVGLETAFVYDPDIFSDGFESGDVSRWSASK